MDISGLMGSDYLNYLTDTASSERTKKLQQGLQGDYSNATDDELMQVCKQFEAYFLEQVFKEVQKTVPDISGATGANKSLIDFYTDSMIQEVAAQATEHSSLGLAQILYEQMKRNISVGEQP